MPEKSKIVTLFRKNFFKSHVFNQAVKEEFEDEFCHGMILKNNKYTVRDYGTFIGCIDFFKPEIQELAIEKEINSKIRRELLIMRVNGENMRILNKRLVKITYNLILSISIIKK